MNLINLYSKQLDFLDLIKIFLFYKKFIIIFFITVQTIVIGFIILSNLSGEQSLFHKKAMFNIYTYPRIKSENIGFLLPDIDVYNEMIKKLDYLPQEIKSQYQNQGGELSFSTVEQIMNVSNIINLYDLFIKFEDLFEFKDEFDNFDLMARTFKTNFIDMPDGDLMTASGVTLEVISETKEDAISFLKFKTEKAYQRLVRHLMKEFNRIIDQIEIENNIIEKNYIQVITRRVKFLETQSSIAKERKIYEPILDSLELTNFEYYKGVEVIESEILSLTRSLKDLKYIPEIQFNYRVIELITNSELYKLLLNEEDLPDNHKILLYDYSDLKVKSTFDLRFINLLIYGILFSIIFIFFIIIIHYSYHRYKFLSNK